MRVYMMTDLEGVSGVLEFDDRTSTDAVAQKKRTFHRRLLTGEDAQQRGLPDAVRPDECDAVAVPDRERDVPEQLLAARELPPETGHLDRRHGNRC